jgi:hypothetical protein
VLISDLIADLRLDLSDSGVSLFEDPTLERCVRKAVFRVGKDLQIDFLSSAETAGSGRRLIMPPAS